MDNEHRINQVENKINIINTDLISFKDNQMKIN